MPDSWERFVATAILDETPLDALWSPCNRFIALAKFHSLELLDAVTLDRLCVFKTPYITDVQRLGFSPDGRFLTLRMSNKLISWDLQTGGQLGVIALGMDTPGTRCLSFKHSKDGKTVAVAYKFHNSNRQYNTFINTYDLLSGRSVVSRQIPEGRDIIDPIWTHDKYLRFATIDPRSIRIWQSPFTLEHPPVEVMSFPAPDGITDAHHFLFFPSLSRLAFTLIDTVQVWDLETPKLLLESELPSLISFHLPVGSFSSDGRFFAHLDRLGVARVWVESPVGYLLHQRLPFSPSHNSPGPRLSPNGKSITLSLSRTIHRWHTRDQDLSLPSVSTDDSGRSTFTLGFSADEKFAAFARRGENTVTTINLQSGEPRWIANVGVEIDCLGMARSTVVLVGEEKIVTWNLPGGDSAFNASIDESVRTTVLHHSSKRHSLGSPTHMSITPDLSRIIVTRLRPQTFEGSLEVDDVSTGLCLASIETRCGMRPWFTQDGREVWAGYDFLKEWEQCEIIEDSESGAIMLKIQGTHGRQSGVLQLSSSGYAVTDGGWVLSPSQKRLLWLPQRWRSYDSGRIWSGRFLGLLHGELSEVVVLEVLE